MRKLIFASASAVALLAAPALAQPISSQSVGEVTQAGAYNKATINQQSATNARSVISQSGTGGVNEENDVVTTQTGDSAFSSVTQSGSKLNKAEVRQDGDNDSTITQMAGRNEAEVSQGGGTGNQSSIRQSGIANVVGDALNGPAVTGVLQTGSDNLSDVTQNSNGSAASVIQTGQRNESAVNQTNGEFGQYRSATINQLGDDNYSSVDQRGSVPKVGSFPQSDVFVTQIGDGNRSVATQAADNTLIDIDQTGDLNRSVVNQLAGAVGASARVTQSSTGSGAYPRNNVEINQSADADAVVTQTGSDHSAIVDQGGAGSGVNVAQTGSGNQAWADQLATGSQINITQGASGNRADVTQSAGSGLQADILQTGTSNDALIAQSGATNDAEILQAGSDATASIVQAGSFHSALIRQ